jgi:hypothetical protein
MKTYKSNRPERYVRIGKALLKIEFTNGLYRTDNPLFQKAIENSEAFRAGEITINKE